MLITFFTCLFVNMEFGIIVGAGLHLLLLLHLGNKPRISVRDTQSVSVIKPPSPECNVVSSVRDLMSFFFFKEKTKPKP